MSEAGAIRMGFDKDGCDILLSFAKNQKNRQQIKIAIQKHLPKDPKDPSNGRGPEPEKRRVS